MKTNQGMIVPTKFINTLRLVVPLFLGGGLSSIGHCQTYTFSTPISGYLQLGITAIGPHDLDNSPGGALTLSLGTLTETVYYNAVSNTIRQVGTISTSPAGSFMINDSAGQPAPYSLTIYQSLNPTNQLSFDTGFYTVGGSPEVLGTISPITGSYSLVTGGQTNTGTFSYSLSLQSFGLLPYTQVSTANYPTSLGLSGGFANYNGGNGVYQGPPSIGSVTAANGDQVQLATGTSDFTDYFQWSASSVTANLVPVAPTITNQPSGVTGQTGSTITLSVGISGTPPLTYQWKFDGKNIAGATNSSLTLSNLSLADVGSYAVGVTNTAGGTNSAPFSLGLVDLKLYAGVVINGPIGQNYTVQSTPVLGGGTNWTTLTNITISTQPYIYIDYSTPTNVHQFYRAVP